MSRLLKTILPIIICTLFGLSFASPAQAASSLPIVLPALTCDALSATDFSAAVGAKVTINHTEMQTSAQGSWCKVSATIAPPDWRADCPADPALESTFLAGRLRRTVREH